MLSTWLNSCPGMDYQHDVASGFSGAVKSITRLLHMKFSTRCDTDSSAPDLFDRISDFNQIEHLLMRRGASVQRIDPAQEPGTGIGWNIGFDWRARARALRLEVVRFDRPERLTMSGLSDSFDIVVDMTVVALGRNRSRLIFETEIRPRNMRARLMLQTAKLGKGQLDRKFTRRIDAFVAELQPAQ